MEFLGENVIHIQSRPQKLSVRYKQQNLNPFIILAKITQNPSQDGVDNAKMVY